MNIFTNTTRPNPALFFKSHDPNDVRLGQTVSFNESDFDKSKYVLIGCPQDEGVKRNHGRIGSAAAPAKIRECFYKLVAPSGLNRGDLFDLGDTIVAENLEATHHNQFEIVSTLIKYGKKVISLGGGNDISYPDCKAVASNFKSVLAFNIDSHFDVRENPVRNSGTPYRQLLEEKIISPNFFFELAFQPFANSDIYIDYLSKKKVTAVSLSEFRKKGIQKYIKSILKSKKASAIFWGIDMDSIRSSDAPGVSASYPTGLSADEILSIASLAGRDKRSKLLEITEVNPKYDIDNRTCKLAALIMYKFLKGD
jgi:formiminoglutamase